MTARIWRTIFGALILATISARPLSAAEPEWPQFRGPNRDGVSQETGLLDEWPKEGPPKVWETSGLGAGYGSISIKGDRVFVQGTEGDKSLIFALRRADGGVIWKQTLGAAKDRQMGNGPRGTPTLDADRIYVLTDDGDLACLKAEDGAKVWGYNVLEKFGAENIGWAISESPLVDERALIVTPGGPGATMVALDKLTGAEIWRSKELSDPAAYASVIAADIGSVRAYMTFTAKAGVGVRASDGKLLWSYPAPANGTANCTTPVFRDNKVFYSSAYGTGCGLLQLTPTAGGAVASQEVYFSKNMQNHHGGVVLVGDHLYGFNDAILACIKFETGELVWRDRSVGKGAVVYADGKLFLLGEDNVVGLALATPSGYQERGRFAIADQGQRSWAHPVVCGGKLYIRNQGILAAYDVKRKAPGAPPAAN